MAWKHSHVWRIGEQFFHKLDNDFQKMIRLGRILPACISSLLCLVVFAWSRDIFGNVGGFVSLTLASFSPTLLAHGRLMTSDTTFTFFFVLSVFVIWKILNRVTPLRLVISGLAVGGLLLSKLSGVFVIPISLVLVLISLWRDRGSGKGESKSSPGFSWAKRLLAIAGSVLVTAGIAYVLIWAAYGFRYDATSDHSEHMYFGYGTVEQVTQKAGGLGAILQNVDQAKLLPESWIYGASFALAESRQRAAFMNGKYSKTGFAMFFPYAVAIKTPIAAILIFGLSAFGLFAFGKRGGELANQFRPGNVLYELTPVAVTLCISWLICLSSSLNIGHRHVLFNYPLCFVFCGAVSLNMKAIRATFSLLTISLLAWFIFESTTTFPDYLGYFNQLVGRENGWKCLVDSNIDWGQDLPAVKNDLAPDRPNYLVYFGTGSAEAYEMECRQPLRHLNFVRSSLTGAAELAGEKTRAVEFVQDGKFDYQPGRYFVSATHIQGVYLDENPMWNSTKEKQLRSVTKMYRELSEFISQQSGPVELSTRAKEVILQFNHLRLIRLIDGLRRQQPDWIAGASVLVYDLDESDLEAALSIAR